MRQQVFYPPCCCWGEETLLLYFQLYGTVAELLSCLYLPIIEYTSICIHHCPGPSSLPKACWPSDRLVPSPSLDMLLLLFGSHTGWIFGVSQGSISKYLSVTIGVVNEYYLRRNLIRFPSWKDRKATAVPFCNYFLSTILDCTEQIRHSWTKQAACSPLGLLYALSQSYFGANADPTSSNHKGGLRSSQHVLGLARRILNSTMPGQYCMISFDMMRRFTTLLGLSWVQFTMRIFFRVGWFYKAMSFGGALQQWSSPCWENKNKILDFMARDHLAKEFILPSSIGW